MYEDEDVLQLTCNNCGHKFEEQIATLKAKAAYTCHSCNRHYWFYPETLVAELDQAKRSVDGSIRDIRPRKGPK